MKLYMLSVVEPDGPMPPAEFLQQVMQKVAVVQKEMKDAGAWVFSGGLHPPSTATVVRSATARCSPPTARSPRARSTSAAS